MLRVHDIKVPVGARAEQAALAEAVRRLRIDPQAVETWRVARKSVDARDKRALLFVYALDVRLNIDENAALARLRPGTAALVPPPRPIAPAKAPPRAQRPVVVGLGPCGLFAALYLARAGLRPVCLERGKRVDARAREVAGFFAGADLNPESNVQFGEGGAGAFSDGKLTTGIKDPRCRQVLDTFIAHGAPEAIGYQAHPHIGTDYLPRVVASIREEILRLGGEVRFGAKLSGLCVRGERVTGLRYLQNGETYDLPAGQILLCIGHSARDTLQALFAAGVRMEQKPFSVGVRIEHRQSLINRAQYGAYADDPALGAAEYKLSCRLPDGRGAYTFCMCPGGRVIAAASQTGGVCTNGMSVYARDGENANAALLVDVRTQDFPDAHPLSGLVLQREWEQKAFRAGGGDYYAPAQRAEDFIAGRASVRLGDIAPTYQPGVRPADLKSVLPAFAYDGLRATLPLFDRQLRGFACPDAVLTGVEARSSSPVRVPRDETLQSSLRGLYPAGEGAGYAGGIMSAAVDGLRAAQAVAESADL